MKTAAGITFLVTLLAWVFMPIWHDEFLESAGLFATIMLLNVVTWFVFLSFVFELVEIQDYGIKQRKGFLTIMLVYVLGSLFFASVVGAGVLFQATSLIAN